MITAPTTKCRRIFVDFAFRAKAEAAGFAADAVDSSRTLVKRCSRLRGCAGRLRMFVVQRTRDSSDSDTVRRCHLIPYLATSKPQMTVPRGRTKRGPRPTTLQNPTSTLTASSALPAAKGSPNAAQNAKLTMPKQAPHEILGVPEDATEAQVRKAYLRLALKNTQTRAATSTNFGSSRRPTRRCATAVGARRRRRVLRPRRRGRTTNASTAQGQAVEALPLRDLRQALLLAPGLARALGGAHEGRGRRRTARRRGSGRGAAPKKDESDDDEPAPRPRRQRPGRATNGGFEAFDRRRSAEARARGGATKNDDDEVCVRCGARGPGDVCRVCGHGPPPDPAKVERRRKAEAARRREEARAAAAANRENSAVVRGRRPVILPRRWRCAFAVTRPSRRVAAMAWGPSAVGRGVWSSSYAIDAPRHSP